MKCRKCGAQIPEGGAFCPECGEKVMTGNRNYEMEEPTEQLDPPTSAVRPTSYVRVEKTGKSKRYLIIGAAVVLVVLLAAVAGYYFSSLHSESDSESNGDKPDSKTEEATEQEEEKEEPEERLIIPDKAKKRGKHYYLVVNDSMHWTEAKKACEEKGGHLATITSKKEQKFIAKLIEKQGRKKNYWLGGTDKGHEGKWKWITGEKWKFSRWRKNQPDNRNTEDIDGDQNYLQICCGSHEDDRYMSWYDVANSGISNGYEGYPNYKTTKHTGYICEWEEE